MKKFIEVVVTVLMGMVGGLVLAIPISEKEVAKAFAAGEAAAVLKFEQEVQDALFACLELMVREASDEKK